MEEYFKRLDVVFKSANLFLKTHTNKEKIEKYRKGKEFLFEDLLQMQIDFKLLDCKNKVCVSETIGGKRNGSIVYRLLENE